MRNSSVSTLSWVILSVICPGLVHAQQDLGALVRANEQRAAEFNAYLGAPQDYHNQSVTRPMEGVRNLKTVLPGVLYRSGGPGGQRPIPRSGLEALCEAGFSQVYYLYPAGFKGEQTVECATRTGGVNRLVYRQQGFQSQADKGRILRAVSEAIHDPGQGAVLVHCWNGYHASGEISGAALVQFCSQDWNSREATEYWWGNQVGAANRTLRIKKFSPRESLRISPALETVLCKKPVL